MQDGETKLGKAMSIRKKSIWSLAQTWVSQLHYRLVRRAEGGLSQVAKRRCSQLRGLSISGAVKLVMEEQISEALFYTESPRRSSRSVHYWMCSSVLVLWALLPCMFQMFPCSSTPDSNKWVFIRLMQCWRADHLNQMKPGKPLKNAMQCKMSCLIIS